MRRVLGLLALVALLVTPGGQGVAAAVDAVPPGLGIRLLEAPTDRVDDPRARSYVVDRVEPGASFTRRIEVTNGDPVPMDVLLYTAPATIAGGGFAVQDRGDSGRIPEWVTVRPERVRLAPGERTEAVVTVRVPVDAPDGEFYGGIVAERPAPPGSGVGVVARVAIRVYLSVGTGSEPISDFVVDTLTAKRTEQGEPLVEARVRNTGGRALDMSGELVLSEGPGGLSAGPFEATLGTTLGIGEEQPVSVLLDKALPAGPWRAELVLRSGEIERAVAGTITFPDAAGQSADPVAVVELSPAEDPGVVVPIAIGLIVLVLLLLLLLWRRRKRKEDEEEGSSLSPQQPTAAVAPSR